MAPRPRVKKGTARRRLLNNLPEFADCDLTSSADDNADSKNYLGYKYIFFERPIIQPLPAFKLEPVVDTVFEKLRNEVLARMPKNASAFAAIQTLVNKIAGCCDADSLHDFLKAEKNKYPVIPGKASFYDSIVSDCLVQMDKHLQQHRPTVNAQ